MKVKKFFKRLGPGLITGISDNDPSGIGTCAQAGAKFGYGQLWSVLFMLPLMIAMQEMCARVGAVKGKGLAYIIKHYYGNKILYPLLLLLLISNIINIGADLGAMAAAVNLIIPINTAILLVFFSLFISALIIFLKYKTYSSYLKWLCLFILVYPITIFIVNISWLELLKNTFVPHIEMSKDYFFMLTGLFGTTISPYMFFWESSQEVEEDHQKHLVARDGKIRIKKSRLLTLRFDNIVGMSFSQICSWSIIVITGAVLHQHGITHIDTAAEAAKSLEPLVHTFSNSGIIAKIIFSLGIIGLGMLAVPIIAASSAYPISELFRWKEGLNLKFKSSHGFYGIILFSTLCGLLLNFLKINPIQALVYAAVINGVVALPLIFMILLIGKNKIIMGDFKNSRTSNFFGWFTFLCMTFSVIAMIFFS